MWSVSTVVESSTTVENLSSWRLAAFFLSETAQNERLFSSLLAGLHSSTGRTAVYGFQSSSRCKFDNRKRLWRPCTPLTVLRGVLFPDHCLVPRVCVGLPSDR